MLVQKLSITYFILISRESRENSNKYPHKSQSIDFNTQLYRYWNRGRFNEYLHGAFDVCCTEYFQYDWRRNKRGITTCSYLTPLHRFDYTLIPYRFFMLLTDWYFIRALWKMNIKIILSEYCHVLVILYAILAVPFPSSIKLSIKVWPISSWFFIHKKCRKSDCIILLFVIVEIHVCLNINLRRIEWNRITCTNPSRYSIPRTRCSMPSLRAYRSTRYRGELLKIRFARYTPSRVP